MLLKIGWSMTSLDDLLAVFTAKLQKTGSLDAALLKIVWVAYTKGRDDERNHIEAPKPPPKWAAYTSATPDSP